MATTDVAHFLTALFDARLHARPPGRSANMIRIDRLLRRLGRPERDLATVLIAGTKGKGSTAAMLAAIEEAAGRRVGLYTKPHLVDYRERIRVNGRLISEEELASLVEEVRPHVEAGAGEAEGAPTYFEVSVALALLHFVRTRADLAILEVGLGGRLDATNICDPLVSVITPISLDHTDVLGRTLAAIAAEKAGIIRPGRVLVTAPQPPEAEEVLRAVCLQSDARLVRVADRLAWTHGSMTATEQRFHLRGADEYGWIVMPLVGRHQVINAATAVTAAEELAGAGFPLPSSTFPDGLGGAVSRGLAGLRWPGRVEVVRENPTVIVDVAHNVAAMQALRDALHEVWPGHRLILVFGMVATHDHEGPAAVIAPLADTVITTRPEHIRPLPPERLAAAVLPYAPHVEIVSDRNAAIARALDVARPRDVICVTGSFYLAGEVRARLLAPPAAPAAQEVALDGAKDTASALQEGAPTSPVPGL